MSEAGASQWRYLQPADLRRLRNFQFAAKLVVEGFYQGKHRSPYYDFSAEFADYRAYTPGDEIRAIDWRAFARTDRFYIKLFRKETDMNCYLLVDRSNSMGYRDPDPPGSGQPGLTKIEYASYMAAALAYLMVQQGDKASLAIAGEGLQAFVPAGGTRQNLQRILTTLERTQAGGPTALARALQTLFGVVKRKGLLIVISDFLDDPGPIFSALGMFAHKGFAVLLFQVLTDAELNLPAVENALFRDLESPLTAAAEPAAIRVVYRAEVGEFLHGLESNARARKMHYQLAVTSAPYHAQLEAYLSARTRLFPNPSGFALNSAFGSFHLDQRDFLKKLESRFAAGNSIFYLWYAPSSTAFTDDDAMLIRSFEATAVSNWRDLRGWHPILDDLVDFGWPWHARHRLAHQIDPQSEVRDRAWRRAQPATRASSLSAVDELTSDGSVPRLPVIHISGIFSAPIADVWLRRANSYARRLGR